eukprot:GFUD01015862.1.p1 GENE.GFUD01015862.1~~GFUD01015862.1.p1  ORF type:complete len:240 (+),score=60.83 GFUD01015862.1:285-1004(+)
MGAPQVTIETITVTRPLKVIAFTCCFITVILMVAATSTADWMIAEGWREGLFMQCINVGAPTPLPFDMAEEVGCGKARGASYLRGAAALVIIGLIFDFFGTFLTGLGLRSTDPNKKYKYYRVAIYALILSLIALLLAAIIYPVQFSKDLANDSADADDDGDGVPDDEDEDDDNDGIDDDDEAGGARTYTFGFGYGATWGSIILIFASVVLLICDRESEEIFYKERQVEEEEEEEENGEA